jgi:hypothetical protein
MTKHTKKRQTMKFCLVIIPGEYMITGVPDFKPYRKENTMGRKPATENTTNETQAPADESKRRDIQKARLEKLRKSEPELAATVDKRLANLWAMQDAANAESATINRILSLGK